MNRQHTIQTLADDFMPFAAPLLLAPDFARADWYRLEDAISKRLTYYAASAHLNRNAYRILGYRLALPFFRRQAEDMALHLCAECGVELPLLVAELRAELRRPLLQLLLTAFYCEGLLSDCRLRRLQAEAAYFRERARLVEHRYRLRTDLHDPAARIGEPTQTRVLALLAECALPNRLN